MLNYVILTTHSSHLYSMWEFTHTCNPKISPSRVSLPLCGPWTSSTHSLLSNRLFTSSTRHPWVSRMPSMGTTCQPSRTSMGTLHIHVHVNLAAYYYLAPFAIYFFSLCVGHLGFLCLCWVGTINTSPPSPHTTMSFNTSIVLVGLI